MQLIGKISISLISFPIRIRNLKFHNKPENNFSVLNRNSLETTFFTLIKQRTINSNKNQLNDEFLITLIIILRCLNALISCRPYHLSLLDIF